MSIGSFFKKMARAPLDAIKGTIGYTSGSDRREAYARDDKRIRRTVRDAEAAGVHPLFALGGATGGSTAFPPSGSQAGEAVRLIQGASRERKRGGRQSSLDVVASAESRARTRLDNARASEIEQQLIDSKNARLTQESNYRQDTLKSDREAVRTFPLESQGFVGPPKPYISIGPGGIRKRNPQHSTAQENEDLHGEFVGEFYTLLNEWEAAMERLRSRKTKGMRKFYEQFPVRRRKFKLQKRYPEIVGGVP